MRFATLLSIIVVLAGCNANVSEQPITDPGRTLTPRGGEGIVLAAEATASPNDPAGTAIPDLLVQLPDDYLPSQALSINLDLDDTEEQIIVFRRRSDQLGLIRILIVSFDPIRNNWIRAWEGPTQATNVRSFSLYTDDLVGDHEQEIVCFGINNEGEQTLDVLRRSTSTLGLGLSYRNILSVSADVNIRVEEVERSEAFDAMEAIAGESYPVIVESLDEESGNDFDTVQTVYLWEYGTARYRPAFQERISGDAIQDSRLRILFGGTEADFEEFLSGPWYRSIEGSESVQIVFFGTAERTIVFHSGDLHLQQAFNWDDSAKTVYGRGVQLFVTNEILRSLKRRISVSVDDLNRINLNVPDSDRLNGTYERLTGSLQASVLAPGDGLARLAELRLRGLYESDTGIQVVFGDPDFTFAQGSTRRTGGYVVFDVADQTILELKYLDENRLPVESRRYGLSYDETRDEDRIIRRIVLQPGTVGIAGFTPSGEPDLVLEQIETIQESDDQ